MQKRHVVRRMLKVAVEVFAIVALSTPLTMHAGLPQSPRCSLARWTEPRALRVFARGAVEDVDVALGRQERYVVGAVADVLGPSFATSAGVSETALHVVSMTGESVLPPTGYGRAIAPKAVIGGDGTLHVVWGQGSTFSASRNGVPRNPRDPIHAATLWYSARNGGKWSVPRMVYWARSIDWKTVASSRLVIDERGALHVAATGVSVTGHWMLLYGTRVHRRWHFTAFRPPTPPIYADVAVGASGKIYLSYVGGRGGLFAPTRAAVLLMRSRDGGVSWSSPRPISKIDEGFPHEPRLLIDGKDVVHIVWTERAAQSLDAVRFWHAQSDHYDGNWTRYTSTDVSGLVTRSQLASDACGRIHLVFEHHTPRGVRIGHASFGDRGWSSPTALSSVNARLPVLASDPWKRLHIVWQSFSLKGANELRSASLVHSELQSLGRRCTGAC